MASELQSSSFVTTSQQSENGFSPRPRDQLIDEVIECKRTLEYR